MMTQDLRDLSTCYQRWKYNNKYEFCVLKAYDFEISGGCINRIQKLIDSIPKLKREQELQREDMNRYRRKKERRERRSGKKRKLPPPLCDHCHGYGLVKGRACWFC
jgi:hypothetical protein